MKEKMVITPDQILTKFFIKRGLRLKDNIFKNLDSYNILVDIIEIEILKKLCGLAFTYNSFMFYRQQFGDIKLYNIIFNRLLEYVSMLNLEKDFLYGFFIVKKDIKEKSIIKFLLYAYKCKNLKEAKIVSQLPYVEGLYAFEDDGYIKFKLEEKRSW